MRVAVTGGKTGGHVFPALAVADALIRYSPARSDPRVEGAVPGLGQAGPSTTADLIYFGMAGGIEERAVPAAGIRLIALPLVTPDSKLRAPLVLVRILAAVFTCIRAMRRFHPDVVLSTGGFVSVPAALAGRILRIPTVIFLPDTRPGMAVRLTGRWARTICVSVDEAAHEFPGRHVVNTGYPVRQAFFDTSREEARRRCGLKDGERQVLVIGGSLGAQTINRVIEGHINELVALSHVVHVCGSRHTASAQEARDGLPMDVRHRYHVSPFLSEDEMANAMLASDVCVSRAGASILGELPAAGLPAVLVPLPAKTVGQDLNAAALERQGGCVVVSNDRAEVDLVPGLLGILRDEGRRKAMAAAMSTLAKPRAATDIVDVLFEAAGCQVAR